MTIFQNSFFTKSFDIGNGNIVTLETGKLARQANGSVMLSMGKLRMLATAVTSKDFKEGADFLPLSTDYQEKYASTGRFPGGFLKRESKSSNYEILISRLIDRAIRPLFPDDYFAEIQVLVTLFSSDENILPDSLAGLAASAAIAISDIPWNGPISEVRVARVDGKLILNPSASELKNADLDIIVAGTEKDINMVEGSMNEVSEDIMVEALIFAHKAIQEHCKAISSFAAEHGKAKLEYQGRIENTELRQLVNELFAEKVQEIAQTPSGKHERNDAFAKLWDEYAETIPEEEEDKKLVMEGYFEDLLQAKVRNMIIEHNQRLDGRKSDEIRPIECEIDFLPSAHGSALFTRGETQSLCTVTLGSKLDEQTIDGAVIQGTDRFMLHYNFPSFSTGEVKPNRGPGRREIGHGNLARRALEIMLPFEEENPYTIRVVSDILESNGSSSMATVCAGCLSLMDAGIKIKKPVSGIAMGLIMDSETGKYAILSDILGDEDHLGDMDFKVTGTENGITACQMDIKIDGLSYDIVKKALEQAKQGRLHILGKMTSVISEPKADYKPHAPRIEKFFVEGEFIGAIIGTGGKVIQQIQKETKTTITIEETEDGRGRVEIMSNNSDSMQAALNWVKGIATKPEAGLVYNGKVKSIVEFGAFVEFLPGKEGLLHNSEYSYLRDETIANNLKQGDMIEVKLLEIDQKTGKFRLSRRALLEKPEGWEDRPERSPFDRSRDHGRGGNFGRNDRSRDRRSFRRD